MTWKLGTSKLFPPSWLTANTFVVDAAEEAIVSAVVAAVISLRFSFSRFSVHIRTH